MPDLAQMALVRINMVAINNFYREKRGGRPKIQMSRAGEGMVDWAGFFTTPAGAGFLGPIFLRVEYGPADIIAAIGRDLAFLCKQVDDAAWGGLS